MNAVFSGRKQEVGEKESRRATKRCLNFILFIFLIFCHFPKYVGDDFFFYITKILAMANTSKNHDVHVL